MNILILFFLIFYLILAKIRLDWAIIMIIIFLPSYLIRFKIFGLPLTLLEVLIWSAFLVWFSANWRRLYDNLRENFKKDGKKVKIRYPFDIEIILLLLVSFAAVAISGFSLASLGIWKAYFFEPILFFIVVLNVFKPPLTPTISPPYSCPDRSIGKGGEKKEVGGEKSSGIAKILWALAFSAFAVSVLAIYQKVTGHLINNSLWAAAETRRVVSFFGYPNAVGLYLGPITLILVGWLSFVIARSEATKQSLAKHYEPEIASLLSVARNDKIKLIFIMLVIIISILSIYFARSKGALVGIAAGLVVFGLLAGKKIRVITIAVLLIAGIFVATYKPLQKVFLESVTLNSVSGQIRKAGWLETWQMLKDGRFITGTGLANYQANVAPYHQEGIFIKDYNDPDAQRKLVFNEEYRTAHWQPLEIYLYPHNIFLNFWSELGLAGMLLFIWIIGKYFYLGILNFQFSIFKKFLMNKYLNIGLISAMIVIIVHGLVDVPYFKNDLAVMFWLFLAMMGTINLELKQAIYGK